MKPICHRCGAEIESDMYLRLCPKCNYEVWREKEDKAYIEKVRKRNIRNNFGYEEGEYDHPKLRREE